MLCDAKQLLHIEKELVQIFLIIQFLLWVRHYNNDVIKPSCSLDCPPGICCNRSPSGSQPSPQHLPISTGTTLNFTFHICSACSFSPWYFSVCTCSLFLMLLSAGIAAVNVLHLLLHRPIQLYMWVPVCVRQRLKCFELNCFSVDDKLKETLV